MATLRRNVRPVSRYDPSSTTKEPPKISGSVVEVQEAPITTTSKTSRPQQPPARRPKQTPRRSSRKSKPTDLFSNHNVDEEARQKTAERQTLKEVKKKKEIKQDSPTRRSSRPSVPTDFFVTRQQEVHDGTARRNYKKKHRRPRKTPQAEKRFKSMSGQQKKRGRPRKYPLAAEKPPAEYSLGALSFITLNSDVPKKSIKRGRSKKNASSKQHRADPSVLSSLMTLNSQEAKKGSGQAQPIDGSKKAAKPKSPPNGVRRKKKRSMIPVREESLLSKAVEQTSSPAVHTTSLLQRLNVFSPNNATNVAPNPSSTAAVQQQSSAQKKLFAVSPDAPVVAGLQENRAKQTIENQVGEPLPTKKRGRPKGSKNKVKRIVEKPLSGTRETRATDISNPRPAKKPAGVVVVSTGKVKDGETKDSGTGRSFEPLIDRPVGNKDATSATAHTARKRGRPKGSKNKAGSARSDHSDVSDETMKVQPAKRRGRPPKRTSRHVKPPAKDTTVSDPQPTKRRGRPPKSTLKSRGAASTAAKDTEVRRRGRPPKSIVEPTEGSLSVAKNVVISKPQPKMRGRPPKNMLQLREASPPVAEGTAVLNPLPEVARRRGRPQKNVTSIAVSGVQDPSMTKQPQTRKRGRPAGSKNKAPLVEASDAVVTDAMRVQSPQAKKRGRPKGSPVKRRSPHRNSPGAQDAISVLVQLHVAAEKNGRREEPRTAVSDNQPVTRSANTAGRTTTGRPKRKAADAATTALAVIAAEEDDIDDPFLQFLETQIADPQPAKRKRGRPPTASSTKSQLTEASEMRIAEHKPVKRKRGRPPKNSSSKLEFAPASPSKAEAVTQIALTKRQGGRSAKSIVGSTMAVLPSTVVSAEEQPAERKRGRPSKNTTELTIRRNDADSMSPPPPSKRKRGRPPNVSKSRLELEDDSGTVRDATETPANTENAVLLSTRRKRQRLRQNASTSTFTMISWADIASIASPPKKKQKIADRSSKKSESSEGTAKIADRSPKKSESNKEMDQLARIGDTGCLFTKRKRGNPIKIANEARLATRRDHIGGTSPPPKKRKIERLPKRKPELDQETARLLNPLSTDPLTTTKSHRKPSKKKEEKRPTFRRDHVDIMAFPTQQEIPRDHVDSMASPPETQKKGRSSISKPKLNHETNQPLKKSLKTSSLKNRVRPSTTRSESDLVHLEQASANANASRPLRSKRKAARSALEGMAMIPTKYETAGLMEEDEYDPSTDKLSRRNTKKKNRKNYIDCGDCLACCLTKNCGRCIPCLDMPEFGGEGELNKQCVLRSCLKPIMRESLTGENNMTGTGEGGTVISAALPADDDDDVQSLSDNASMIMDDMSDLEWNDDSPSASAKTARATLHREAAPELAARTTETAADLVRKLREQDRSRQLEYGEESDSEDEDLIPPPPPIDF